MPIDERTTSAEEMLLQAHDAERQAEQARQLARDIDSRRGVLLGRLDESVASHTEDVWSSIAASVSRTTLQRDLTLTLFYAGELLNKTGRDLEMKAATLEDQARGQRNRAADLVVAPPEEPKAGSTILPRSRNQSIR